MFLINNHIHIKYSSEKAAFMRKCLTDSTVPETVPSLVILRALQMRRQSSSFPNCSYVLCHVWFFFAFETQQLLELKSLTQLSLSKTVSSASSTSKGCLFRYTVQHPLVSAVAIGRAVRSWAPKTVNFNFSSTHFYTLPDKHPL